MKILNIQTKAQNGFSIIEVLVVIFVLVLVGAVVITFYQNIFSLNIFLSQSLIAQEEARRTFKTMSAEIRTASPSSVGAYPIEETSETSFVFYTNTDKDELKERVRYFLDGSTLKKGVVKPSGDPLTYDLSKEVITELVHDVANGVAPVFNYYDTHYEGTTEPLVEPFETTAVRLVKITVIINRDPNSPPGPITITTQISMRNLKDNL